MNENVQSSDDLLLSFNQNSFCLSTSRAKMKELLRCAANIVLDIEIMQWFPKHLPGDRRGSGGVLASVQYMCGAKLKVPLGEVVQSQIITVR